RLHRSMRISETERSLVTSCAQGAARLPRPKNDQQGRAFQDRYEKGECRKARPGYGVKEKVGSRISCRAGSLDVEGWNGGMPARSAASVRAAMLFIWNRRPTPWCAALFFPHRPFSAREHLSW